MYAAATYLIWIYLALLCDGQITPSPQRSLWTFPEFPHHPMIWQDSPPFPDSHPVDHDPVFPPPQPTSISTFRHPIGSSSRFNSMFDDRLDDVARPGCPVTEHPSSNVVDSGNLMTGAHSMQPVDQTNVGRNNQVTKPPVDQSNVAADNQVTKRHEIPESESDVDTSPAQHHDNSASAADIKESDITDSQTVSFDDEPESDAIQIEQEAADLVSKPISIGTVVLVTAGIWCILIGAIAWGIYRVCRTRPSTIDRHQGPKHVVAVPIPNSYYKSYTSQVSAHR